MVSSRMMKGIGFSAFGFVGYKILAKRMISAKITSSPKYWMFSFMGVLQH